MVLYLKKYKMNKTHFWKAEHLNVWFLKMNEGRSSRTWKRSVWKEALKIERRRREQEEEKERRGGQESQKDRNHLPKIASHLPTNQNTWMSLPASAVFGWRVRSYWEKHEMYTRTKHTLIWKSCVISLKYWHHPHPKALLKVNTRNFQFLLILAPPSGQKW